MDASTPRTARFARLRIALDGLARRLSAQRWVIATASAIALGAAIWSALPGAAIMACWLAVTAAALASTSRLNAHLARREGADGRRGGGGAAARALAATLPDPCFLLTADGRLVYQNPAAQEIFGAIAPGRAVTNTLRAPDLADALAAVRDSGEPRMVAYFERIPIERRFEAHIAPLPGNGADNGRGRGGGADAAGAASVVIVLRDLTEQQRLDRMRADFVANASHELRTPLASLSGFIETLQGAAKDDPAAREKFLEIMRVQARRMSRLIGDLLSLSRIELNVHVRPAAQVDLRGVVSGVAEALGPLAQEAGVEIALVRPEAPVNVTGERDELAQVFQNLIENAIKYGESGKRVEITVDTPEDDGARRARVAVRDFGAGIAEEHIPRLTERFYRVDAASSREKGGTGLGLAIVKHILNRHRGQLQIRSTPGEGATFSVTLPLAPGDGNSDNNGYDLGHDSGGGAHRAPAGG